MASSNGRGMLFLPRIGDEVIVSFIQGDPDQPVIIGSLYNAANTPPYALPANKTVSTIRSTGTIGQPSEINEIKFDDKAGSQLLNISAAKDMNLSAVNNFSLNVTGALGIKAGAQTTFTGPVSIGGGNAYNEIQTGQAIMPGSSTVETNFTVTFPQAFSAIPKVVASISGDPNFASATDTFAMSVRAVTSTTGFTVNVIRVDAPTGWSQQLRINWQAWQ